MDVKGVGEKMTEHVAETVEPEWLATVQLPNHREEGTVEGDEEVEVKMAAENCGFFLLL